MPAPLIAPNHADREILRLLLLARAHVEAAADFARMSGRSDWETLQALPEAITSVARETDTCRALPPALPRPRRNSAAGMMAACIPDD